MEADVVKSEIPLPDELLSAIISQFIPLCQWPSCLENVSKQFQRCVLIAYSGLKSVDCRKLFSIKKIKRYDMSEDKISENCIRLKNILEKLLAVCPYLAEIDGFYFVTSDMRGISDFWDILAQFDCLKSISLTSIENIASRSFADFVLNSKCLKNLEVYGCRFDADCRLNVGSLSVLNFDCMLWPHICLENLSEKLVALTLDEFSAVFQNPCVALKNCTNLEYFSVYLFSELEYEIFISMLPSLCKLANLQIKWRSMSYQLPSAFDRQFCDQLNILKNQLKCIEISRVIFSEEVQYFLLTECLQLESLQFRKSVLSAGAVQNLPRLPVNLKKLSFPDPNGDTLPLMLPKLVNLPNFTDLNVTGFCNFNSANVKELENISCLVNLENLQLHGTFIDDNLLRAWDNKNPEMFEKLVSFRVDNCCWKISDAGATLLAKKARNLKILDLWHSNIGEKTISALGDVAKKLTEMNLSQAELPIYKIFDENSVISFIKKAICLKKVKISQTLAKKIIGNENFFLLIENVEIVIAN